MARFWWCPSARGLAQSKEDVAGRGGDGGSDEGGESDDAAVHVAVESNRLHTDVSASRRIGMKGTKGDTHGRLEGGEARTGTSPREHETSDGKEKKEKDSRRKRHGNGWRHADGSRVADQKSVPQPDTSPHGTRSSMQRRADTGSPSGGVHIGGELTADAEEGAEVVGGDQRRSEKRKKRGEEREG
ncbi:hypothetical protein DFH08DRAFT_825099 [Mycena albidolilacea]|uniref:Uncharacterized protein n=1 Tax=Mycena albidolilacea TaxID=1033008 RepID=A0AAD6Z3M8_9AGAR|nr:hypothetical protein DFH08DRAFT_825099 [Mycena albidolilacea]